MENAVLKVGSLFAGIGGFDFAAETVGMTVAWQSEIDQKASAVLDHHWPDVPNLGDIHGINAPTTVDVLTGGFPCQDYSVAGNREGLAGDRGALWWEYHRLIDAIRPRWVIGENVAGLLSSRNGADFQTIIDSLTKCGYGVAWAVLDAQHFGVAQRRRRVFIVGHSGGQPRPEILALAEGLYGHPAPSRKAGQTVAPTLSARTKGGGGLGTDVDLDNGLVHTDEVSYALRASASQDRPESGADSLIAFSPIDDGRDATEGLSPTLRVGSATGGNPMAVAYENAFSIHDGVDGVSEILELSGSLNTAGGKAGQGYQVIRKGATVRRLTPLECERLQGFPDNWTNTPGNSDTQRYRQLGNAVAVPVVAWILNNIVSG